MNEDTTTYPILFGSQEAGQAQLDQPSFEAAPIEASAPPAAARQKLEFLLRDLEADVMLAANRMEHVRMIQRIETLKDALSCLPE